MTQNEHKKKIPKIILQLQKEHKSNKKEGAIDITKAHLSYET